MFPYIMYYACTIFVFRLCSRVQAGKTIMHHALVTRAVKMSDLEESVYHIIEIHFSLYSIVK